MANPNIVEAGLPTRFNSETAKIAAAKQREAAAARRAELELKAAEVFESRLLDAVDTYLEVMDNGEQPGSTRLAAADRIVERMIGKVGDRLLVQQESRAEVTVKHDVQHLADLVTSLRNLGAIDPDVEPQGSVEA